MALSQKDLKLLWGRSGNRCALCKVLLSADAKGAPGSFVLGEQAHIVGEQSDAPRGISVLSEEQRNTYFNIILLCPNDHTMIDKNVTDWPVEQLYIKKAQHEQWVQESLAETVDIRKVAEEAIVASLIDEAVESCRFRKWLAWTSRALAPDPVWSKEWPDQLANFRHKIIAAIWPDNFEELKRATITLSVLLHQAAQTFLKHSQQTGNLLHPVKFYQTGRHNPRYDEDLKAYNQWLDQCYEGIIESTKAANWFADVVRRESFSLLKARTQTFHTAPESLSLVRKRKIHCRAGFIINLERE